MEKISVLVIDDHKLVRDAFTFVFSQQERFHVIENKVDCEQAINIVKQYRPDIVLLDINMVSITGFELLGLIRKYSPSTKVIAVSLYIQPTYARKMLNKGAKGYVTKNSEAAELFKAVDEILCGNIYISEDVRSMLTKQWIDEEEELGNRISLISTRELEIIKLLRSGLSSKEIGERLNIGAKTVEVHRHNILRKLKVKNTASLIEIANIYGL